MKTIKSLLVLASLLVSSSLFSQVNPNKWQALKTVDKVVFSEKLTDCSQPEEGYFAEFYLVKIENTNNFPVTVTFEKDFAYNGKDAANDGMISTYTIKPGESVEGTCDFTSDSNLKIFKKFLKRENKVALTKHSVKNIQVNPLSDNK
jgi:hypothetical protein